MCIRDRVSRARSWTGDSVWCCAPMETCGLWLLAYLAYIAGPLRNASVSRIAPLDPLNTVYRHLMRARWLSGGVGANRRSQPLLGGDRRFDTPATLPTLSLVRIGPISMR